MIKVDARGDSCPIPVIKTKQAINQLENEGIVEVLVDNEIAVQNLTKMAVQKKYGIKSAKLSEGNYQVLIQVGNSQVESDEQEAKCILDNRLDIVVVISSRYMGSGDDKLGQILMKGFIYALSQLEVLPKTILFYNSGAFLTCEESALLEDLRSLEAQGVEILTCGTCMNHYGLEDKLKIGSVTNMYVIAEKMMTASKVVKP